MIDLLLKKDNKFLIY